MRTDWRAGWVVGLMGCDNLQSGRGQLKCNGTRAETRLRLLAKWMSPFKSAGASSRLLAAEVRASPCYEVVRKVLATHSIHQFPLRFPSHASPCAITFTLSLPKLHIWFQALDPKIINTTYFLYNVNLYKWYMVSVKHPFPRYIICHLKLLLFFWWVC